MKQFETELQYFNATGKKNENLRLTEVMQMFGVFNNHIHTRDGYIWAIYEKEIGDDYQYAVISNHVDITKSMMKVLDLEQVKTIDLNDYEYLAGKKLHE